jgi:hypothetical protein
VESDILAVTFAIVHLDGEVVSVDLEKVLSRFRLGVVEDCPKASARLLNPTKY